MNLDAIAIPIAMPAPSHQRVAGALPLGCESACTTQQRVQAIPMRSGASGVAKTIPTAAIGIAAKASRANCAARGPESRSAVHAIAAVATVPATFGRNRTPSGVSPRSAVPPAINQAIIGG